jgi:hypothetical protein
MVTSDVVQLEAGYADGSAYDSRFVNENQSNSIDNSMIIDGTIQLDDMGPNSVNSDKIVNGTIQFADMGSNGAVEGDLMRFNGSTWEPARQGFPAPDYNSGWFHLSPGGDVVLYHNLGVDINDQFVDLQKWDIDDKQINDIFGGHEYLYSDQLYRYGAYWEKLQPDKIRIVRMSHDWTADSIRVRIWIVE